MLQPQRCSNTDVVAKTHLQMLSACNIAQIAKLEGECLQVTFVVTLPSPRWIWSA
jgi:hypothetical protein